MATLPEPTKPPSPRPVSDNSLPLWKQAIALPAPPERSDWDLERGDFMMSTEVPRNKQVTVYWVRPRQPDPRRQTLVVYCQHPVERFFAVHPHRAFSFERLAGEAGVTVMGLFFDHQIKGRNFWGDPLNYLHFWNHAYEATLAAIDRMRQDHPGLHAVALTFGSSAGGTFAQRLGEYAPQRFDGVVALGGSHFAKRDGAQAACLFLNTNGDATDHWNEKIARLYRKRQHGAVIRCVTPPEWGRRGRPQDLFHHCLGPQAVDLAIRFVSGLATMKATNHGRVPPADTWPVHVSLTQARVARAGPCSASAYQALPSLACYQTWLMLPEPPIEGDALFHAQAAPAMVERRNLLLALPCADEGMISHGPRAYWDSLLGADRGYDTWMVPDLATWSADQLRGAEDAAAPLYAITSLSALSASQGRLPAPLQGLAVVIDSLGEPQWDEIKAQLPVLPTGATGTLIWVCPDRSTFAELRKTFARTIGEPWSLHLVGGTFQSTENRHSSLIAAALRRFE